jgi:NAD(P)-dependent dehydrogenase (short-subunit alcohol dehydrogenase family)
MHNPFADVTRMFDQAGIAFGSIDILVYNAGVYQAMPTPLGRIGTPLDIARVVVFLASEDSGWLTGEIIHATGGL